MINHKTADRITVDNQGITCELWVIPSFPRYYLVRRNNDWSVYDRRIKRPMSRYTKSIGKYKYHYVMLIKKVGGIRKYQQLHKLVMECLSFEKPCYMVRHHNGDTLDNRFENLYYYLGKGTFKIKDTYTGEVFEGTLKDLHRKTGLSHVSICGILSKDKCVKGFKKEVCHV